MWCAGCSRQGSKLASPSLPSNENTHTEGMARESGSNQKRRAWERGLGRGEPQLVRTGKGSGGAAQMRTVKGLIADVKEWKGEWGDGRGEQADAGRDTVQAASVRAYT